MISVFRASWPLFKREVIRFVRQKNRVVGALGTPLVFWILLGSGVGSSFNSPAAKGAAHGMNYLLYFFPGTLLLILLFTAIFASIAIIEDRREGFLQAVLVAPVSRSTIVLGNLWGGTALATIQGMLVLLIAPFIGINLSFLSTLMAIFLMLVLAFGLSGLGFLIAWRLDSTQGFHAIMNLFLIPLWLLSGAIFPIEGAPAWLKFVMVLNPLKYGLAALHQTLFDSSTVGFFTTPAFLSNFAVTAGFAVLMLILAVLSVHSKKSS